MRLRVAIITSILIVLSLYSDIAMGQVAGYSNRLKYQVNASQVEDTTDISNFPVLISLTDNDLRTTGNGGFVENANGYDIIFTAANGTTILSHQLEEYNATTGEIIFWVRFPTLGYNTDTEFYIYFGNSGIASDQSSTNVWDSNYKLVMHLNEAGSGGINFTDASGNISSTDITDNATVATDGQVSGGRLFDDPGTGDLITIADNGVSPLDISGNITISVWINISNVASGPDIISKGSYLDGYAVWVNGSGLLRFQINNSALSAGTGTISNGSWNYIVATRASNGDRVLYLNGAQIASDNNAASFEVNDDDLFLSTASFDFEGSMDEFRLSNITRDSAWIATEYNNKNSPGTFITEINAEPIAADIEGANLTYNSGDSPTAITSAITLTDGNDTDLESATVQITGNFNDAQDVLGFVDQNGISGSYSSVTGILTLTGTSSVANYQTALRSVTYENTDASPTTATRTISFTVNDGTDDSNTETRDITVIKVNIDPVLANIESSNLVYFASSGERVITSSLEVSDVDDVNLDSAVVEITSGYISSEDTLRFVDQNGITSIWNETSGKLTLTGSATTSVYEAALRTVTYENESGSPTMTNRTISIRVNDGENNSNTETRDVEYPTSISDLTNYKADVVFHFDAQDADGNGDSGTGQPADGTLASWIDITGNITTTAPGGDEPTLDASYFGERSGILFDYNSGNNGDHYPLSEPAAGPSNTINLGTFTEKSFAIVFRTTDNIDGLQVMYEQGGSSRGYQLSFKDGNVYAYAYSNNWSSQNQSINLGSVERNTSYILIASHGSTGSDASSHWRASLNGGTIQELTGANDMANHGGDPNIGEEDGTRDPTTFGNPANTNNFDGFVGEFISWNDSLVASDFTNIYGFLSEKWFNVPPVLADIEVSNLSYSEGEGTANITSSITVTDTDNTNLDSAKVSITSGFESSEDVLAYATALGISGSYDSGSGVLTLTGTTTVANYQTALRNVTYENTETTTPSTTTREISFIVYDWDDSSAVVTREIDISPNNDLPELANLEGTTIAFTEGDAATSISSDITVSDTDDTNLEGATVAFTNNYFLGEDELAYSTALGITGSFDAMSGVLTLTGSTTLANYETALRNVTYENTSSDPVTGLNRTIEVRVFDGIDSSATGTTRDISVASLNTAPTLANIESSSIFYQVGDSSIISETITLTDPDDTDIETVTFQITTNYNSAEDTLVFQPLFGISQSWTDGTGTLTLSGPASKADFQSAVRTVRYQSTTTTPADLPRTVTITANDGDVDSNVPTREISFSIPKSVNNLLLWLKGDEGTFTTSGGSTPSTQGSAVGRWEDQSGSGRDFSTTGTTPVFQTSVSALNSQNAIEFPGGSAVRLEDTDAENYLNGLSELTIFFVIDSDGVATDRGFWTTYEPDGTSGDQVFSIRYDDLGDNGGANDVITTGMRDLNVAFVQESFEEAQTTSGQIVMLKWKSENNYQLYVDGVLSNPTFFQNIPTGVLTNVTTAIIGQGTQDVSDSWDGLIAEVILYGEDISTEDQEAVEDYLSIKYGIAIRSLTAATGGEAISADDASIAPSPAYTTLTGPRVQESFEGEFTLGGTFVFTAPTGFEWNAAGSPSASVQPAFGGTTDLAVSAAVVTSTEITFTITTESSNSPGSKPGEITFSNFEVRPTTGTLPNTGNITNTGTTGLGGSTSYGTLTMVAGTQIEMEFAEQPSASNVSSAISPAVRVQLIDQFGNPVEESRVNIDIARNIVSGSGNLGGTTTEQTNVFGIAEFDDINIDAIGTYSLTASSTGLADTTSNEFDVVILGQLTQFVVERVPSGNISNKLAGQNFNITVVAVDGIQDTVDTFTGTVSLSSNCTMGTGQGTTASFVAGVLSSATVSISSLGTCSITATNSAGSETGTSNTFDVTPGAPSEATTTISASPTVILNDGFSTSTITVQLKDSEGNNVTTGGETIVLSETDGTLSSVTDNSDGTYTATLTSSVVAGTATITGTLNAAAITDNAEVEFAEFNNLWQSSVGSVADARNWDLATNWSSGSVPVPGDKVLVPAVPAVGNEQPVVSTTDTEIAQLSVEASASVTVSGGIELIVNGELSGDGEVLGSNTDSVTVAGNLGISDMSVGFVKLNGTNNQDVTTPNDYVNLELDNSNGADFTTDLSVSDTLKLTNGTLFLPTGTTLIANEKQYGNGELRMQQRMFGDRGWRLLSSPIDTTFGEFLDGVLTQGYSGSTLGNAPLDSLQPTVLTYLESYDNGGAGATDNERFRAPTSASQKVTQGQGMFVFLFGDIPADSRYNDPLPDTLDVSGQEFDGDGTEVNFNVTYTTTADSGWNLVGNPFLATIDWDDEANWTKTNIESTIYIWDPSANGGDGEYLTWNGTTGTLPNGGLIPPFQGFWIKANDASPVLSVNKEAKTTGGSFLRKELPKGSAVDTLSKQNDTPIPILDFAVSSASGRQKRTNFMFSDKGLRNKDILDAYTLSPLTSSFIEFHSLLDNGSQLAINSLPIDFNSRLFIPLHIAAFENGVPTSEELTIIWDELRGIPEDWILTLIDNNTGAEINVMEERTYSFFHSTRAKVAPKANPSSPNFSIRAKAGTQSTRFTLKVSTEQIERDVPEEVFLSQNYPNPFNPSTTIPFGLNEDSNVELVVYDILGRKVQTLVDGPRTAGRYEIQFNSRELASGVYFYRLTTNNKVLLKKFTLIK